MYVCMYGCRKVCVCVCVCLCVCVYIHTYIHHTYIHTYLYIPTFVCKLSMYVFTTSISIRRSHIASLRPECVYCMYGCMYVLMYVCMYVCRADTIPMRTAMASNPSQ